MAQSKFTPKFERPENLENPAYWFIFQNDRVLILEREDVKIPHMLELSQLGIESKRELYLGELGKHSCFGVHLEEGASIPSGAKLLGLRDLFGHINEPLFAVAGRAFQILKWEQNHHFCGRCGSATEHMENERAKHCPSCGLTSYPRISPAVIVSIIKGDQILMSRSPHFTKGIYSVQAGFVDPGETLEEAVHREVDEEVGIKVKNVKYFGSQPWPFPHSLMIGFTAEYESGELEPDPEEIEDAMWCTKDQLPNLPHPASIARRLVEDFLSK